MSQFQDELELIDRVRVRVTRELVNGRISGFDLLEVNSYLDDEERKVKARRLAVMLEINRRRR